MSRKRAHTGRFLAALATLATGCSSSSVVVRPDDRTFARAAARLERTLAEVEASGTAPSERALFLQAEAFHDYRFDIGNRGGAAFLAEAAAAITDLPALQSFAGSLDLLDVRLRAADAAVQLWETFLLRHPGSPLRPLALWRLGWAYRSAGVAGLPRDSGDEAWAELVRSAPASPLAALVPPARAVEAKSKSAAAHWSIVPGLGQFYVGETAGGAARLAVAAAALAAIVTPLVIGIGRGSDLSWSHDWPLLAVGAGGLIVLSFDYTSSYNDAMRRVIEWNERGEAAFEEAHPDAP